MLFEVTRTECIEHILDIGSGLICRTGCFDGKLVIGNQTGHVLFTFHPDQRCGRHLLAQPLAHVLEFESTQLATTNGSGQNALHPCRIDLEIVDSTHSHQRKIVGISSGCRGSLDDISQHHFGRLGIDDTGRDHGIQGFGNRFACSTPFTSGFIDRFLKVLHAGDSAGNVAVVIRRIGQIGQHAVIRHRPLCRVFQSHSGRHDAGTANRGVLPPFGSTSQFGLTGLFSCELAHFIGQSGNPCTGCIGCAGQFLHG